MSADKIVAIKIFQIHAPLKIPFKTALRTVTALEDIVIEIHSASGLCGYGSAAPTVAITGESIETIVDTIQNHLAPKVLQLEVDSIPIFSANIPTWVQKNTSAKACVEMALLDLFCKSKNLTFAEYLGIAHVTKMRSDATVTLSTADDMVVQTKALQAEGFKSLKIKIGNDVEEDLLRLNAVVKNLANDVSLRLDANQGWSEEESLKVISYMKELRWPVEFVEQPVKAHDLDALRNVSQNSPVPIVADESIFSLEDARKILDTKSAHGLSIKLAKTGGILEAQKILHLALKHRTPCLMSCMFESNISLTAAAFLAVSTPIIQWVDLDVAMFLKEDPVVGGMVLERGRITLPKNKLGLGIDSIKYARTISIVQ